VFSSQYAKNVLQTEIQQIWREFGEARERDPRAKTPRDYENSEERWTTQVAPSRGSYARAILVVVSVTVKEPSNKPASFKPQLH
jgi:hypothetical protein